MPEARLETFGSGLTPVTQGWFVVNVRDAEWWDSARRGAGARCGFENEYGDSPVDLPAEVTTPYAEIGLQPPVG